MKIAFLMYPERGACYPTFRLTKELLRRGHQVSYFGVREFEEKVRAQGLIRLSGLG